MSIYSLGLPFPLQLLFVCVALTTRVRSTAVAMALLRFISYDLWVTFSSHLDLLIFATRSANMHFEVKS